MGGLSALIDGLGNFVGWLLITPAAAAAEAGRRLWRRTNDNADRVDDVEKHLELGADQTRLERHDARITQLEDMADHQQRALYGDPKDPEDAGMRGEVHDIHAALDDED
jgi:hypothetical protein